MLDSPDARTILGEVQSALKAGIAPGFQQAVAANAVALAQRENELAVAEQTAEQGRLAALLGHDGDLAALNHEFAEAISARSIDPLAGAASAHLIATTLAKIAVDQPNYPAYRALLGDHA